jgi:hypothetical protein
LRVIEHAHVWQVNIDGRWMAFDKLTNKSTDGVYTLFSITNWTFVKPNSLVVVEEEVNGETLKNFYYTTGKCIGSAPSDWQIEVYANGLTYEQHLEYYDKDDKSEKTKFVTFFNTEIF